jgi:hypothetical protein
LQDLGVALDVYDDLANAFADGEAMVNVVGALLAPIVKGVAALLPDSRVEARMAGEELQDTVILPIQGNAVLFEQGPWSYE